MGNYLGVKCPVCQKKFAGSDDIVVCPVCGAPHHRECYAQRGECVFNADHISGMEWRPPEAEAAQERENGQQHAHPGAKNCNRCGSASPKEALFCQICGQSLGAPNSCAGGGQAGRPPWPGGYGHMNMPGRYGQNSQVNYSTTHAYQPRAGSGYDPFADVEKNATISEIPARDVAMYVGRNYRYFLPRFYHMERTGRVIQPNVAAGLLNFFYYFYRRMYVMGAAMLVAFLVCFVPFFLAMWELLPVLVHESGLGYLPEATEQVNWQNAQMYSRIFTTAMMLNFFSSIIISLFANWIYHKHVIVKIRQSIQDFGGTSEYRLELPRIGGVDRISVVLLAALLFLGSNVALSVMVFYSNLL